jgi:hypothetical protein
MEILQHINNYFIVVKFRPFWHVALCSNVEVYQYFRGVYCVHHQGD